MSINQVFKIKNNVRVRQESFGCLVFTNRTPILSFNNDSYRIWQEIDGIKNSAQITKSMKKKYSNVEIREEFVEDFLNTCISLDLIELI